MLSKCYESTEVDRRTWLHVPSGTHWSTSSDTHQVVEIKKETSTKMYTPLKSNDQKVPKQAEAKRRHFSSVITVHIQYSSIIYVLQPYF